jgi:dolichol-phosphate mannosyltransferase
MMAAFSAAANRDRSEGMDTPPHSAQTAPSVSLIVPTYCEAENLPELLNRVSAVRSAYGAAFEMLIMDDNSGDGTVEVVEQSDQDWVRLIVRKDDRGLSAAVLDGFRAARHEVLVVMDADLSHPPEKLPELVEAIAEGADFALGSRYVTGGQTDEAWGLFRWFNSKVATLLARPFTHLKDPMSGFFAIRRETFENAAPLNPIGYKIGLEVLVKGGCTKPREIPIHFYDRKYGESKLNLREQLRYLLHLRRLFVYKYENWAYLAQFCAVGASGLVVNVATLTLMVLLGMPARIAAAVAIGVAMFTNFLLNRRITFSYARTGPFFRQMVGFFTASSLGAVLNYGTMLLLFASFPLLETYPQPAAVAGTLVGLVSNFLLSRFVVFAKSPAD